MAKSFDDFMWKKTLGLMKSLKLYRYGGGEVHPMAAVQYQRNVDLLKRRGVLYPDWKAAKRILK